MAQRWPEDLDESLPRIAHDLARLRFRGRHFGEAAVNTGGSGAHDACSLNPARPIQKLVVVSFDWDVIWSVFPTKSSSEYFPSFILLEGTAVRHPADLLLGFGLRGRLERAPRVQVGELGRARVLAAQRARGTGPDGCHTRDVARRRVLEAPERALPLRAPRDPPGPEGGSYCAPSSPARPPSSSSRRGSGVGSESPPASESSALFS